MISKFDIEHVNYAIENIFANVQTEIPIFQMMDKTKLLDRINRFTAKLFVRFITTHV